jgi:hypothetical protein
MWLGWTLAVWMGVGQTPHDLSTERPQSMPIADLADMTRTGELMFLPKHQKSPFDAFLVTSTARSCKSVERIAMDVKGYPRHWPHMREGVKVIEKEPNKVRYAFKLDVMFSPTIEGLVENPHPGRIIFWDPESGGKFIWDLKSHADRCIMFYHLHQPLGKQSGFVKLVQHFEDDVADAAELAGGIATCRGYRIGNQRNGPIKTSVVPRETWTRLAGGGTVLRTQVRQNQIMLVYAARRIQTPAPMVLKRIKDHASYAGELDFLTSAAPVRNKTKWRVAYFGGRVNFATETTQSGDLTQSGIVRIKERVVGGDLEEGEWEWTIRQVPGGTEIDLRLDLDLTRGSRILGALASQDPLVKDAAVIQVALKFMGQIVGGESHPLSRSRQIPIKHPLEPRTNPQDTIDR